MDLCEVYIRHPFTMVLAGPTGSGKTYWLKNLVNNRFLSTFPAPQKIIYYYGEWQSTFATLDGVDFIQGMPSKVPEDIGVPQWIVLDDLMTESLSSK